MISNLVHFLLELRTPRVDHCHDVDRCQYHFGIDHCQDGNRCQDGNEHADDQDQWSALNIINASV